jgi:signal transduction histidine kinase/DNA-binding response OmpR family regulator
MTADAGKSSKVNILLVDDNESNLVALQAILQAEGRNLIRAASGDEALQYLLDNDVAVVLLDVRMPGISGLETARLIRGRKRSRDLPIIFLTAYDSVDKKDLSEGYSLGAVDYIIKPLDPEALKSKVAVFVELFKKTEQVKQQAALLREKNIQLENANFERLGKLVELGQRLTAERDPEELLQLFCDAARDIIDARSASVKILEANGEVLQFVSSRVSAAAAGAAAPPADGDLLRMFSSLQYPVRAARHTTGLGHLAGTSGVNSLLTAPICAAERTFGWLYLTDKLGGDEFSEADERLAMTLSAQLAVAYENARMHADAQRHAEELLQEVTERKQAEKERERLLQSEKVARLEAEEARELSSALLVRERESRAEAEAANRLKDEFLATVSHELRTPLNAMLGWAELLKDRRLDDARQSHAVETIERNGRTLARIVDDILDASRIITGKLGLDLRPLEIATVIDAAADVLRPAADAKRIMLELAIPRRGGPIVLGDADRLQQVVWNLLSNAIKFSPGPGLIRVTLERVTNHACIKVSDSGQGISLEFLPYVFERFRQADSSMTRSAGGLGLGLAIVRHLVELHGGSVSAESDGPGLGSTFIVSVPLALADPQLRCRDESTAAALAAAATELPQDASENPSSGLAGVQVLVVDDHADTCELVMEMIQYYGAQAKGASSAAEALNVLGCWKPDVILSDIGMAGEDGYKLIQRVRALPASEGGDIPAAAMTAYVGEEDRLRAISAGYQAHIPKPINRDQLIEVLSTLSGRARVS